MADRVGIIRKGELILVEDKAVLMQKLGRKELHLELSDPLTAIPPALADWNLKLNDGGTHLTYLFDAKADRTGIPTLLAALRDSGIGFKDLETKTSSLEDIFVDLIHGEGSGG
jgi:ABC-2 type transport system ATP-binding protein